MLRSLSISNFVLIDNLNIDFKSGFTTVTGQTGAGKSIIFEALNFILGARASTRFIKCKEKTTVVCGVFTITEPLERLLEEKGIAVEDELIIRRVIYSDGRSRAYVNDNITTLGIIEKISQYLVEFCGQHSHKGLMDASTHVEIIDQYGGIIIQAKKVKSFTVFGKQLKKNCNLLKGKSKVFCKSNHI